MKLLAGAIVLSSVILTAGMAASGRYTVEVSQNGNVQAAWILDSWTGELTFCRPSTGQMASYIDILKLERPGISNYATADIIEQLPAYDPDSFGGLNKREIIRSSTKINSCLPGK